MSAFSVLAELEAICGSANELVEEIKADVLNEFD